MKENEKLSMEEMVEKLDAAKKINPLDLSSDQDLTIALMNLISLEEHFFFSGAKTKNPAFYEMIDTIREMRKELMSKIVNGNTGSGSEVWCISKHLLAASMRLMEVGTKAQCSGKKQEAHELFEKSYDLYSLFWGLNMNLIDVTGVKKITSDINVDISHSEKEEKTAEKECILEKNKETSLIKRLGGWVKNSVNCCIE